MTRAEVDRLWNALQQTWGARFGETYGPNPNPAWLAALQAIPPEAGMAAYQSLLEEGSPHPPTLPEFVSKAKAWRPASAILPAPERRGPPATIEELRAAASREVASFETYRDYTRWRATNTRKQTLPPHPTAGSADWLYLQRLAWIEAAIENASAARG